MEIPPVEPPDEFRKKLAEKYRKKRRRKEEKRRREKDEEYYAFSVLGVRDLSWAPMGERIVVLPDGRVIRIPAVPYF